VSTETPEKLAMVAIGL
jgi:ABC-type multidrug transport system fused ATPase/permease subunit